MSEVGVQSCVCVPRVVRGVGVVVGERRMRGRAASRVCVVSEGVSVVGCVTGCVRESE